MNLTAGVKHQVRPIFVQETFLSTELDSLELSRETTSWSELLQASKQLDQSTNEDKCNLTTETLMDAITESLQWLVVGVRTPAIRLEFRRVGNIRRVLPGFALYVDSLDHKVLTVGHGNTYK